jgi:hypothetical protein
LTGSVLKVWGGDQPDAGIAQMSQTVFERRFQFTEAAMLQLGKEWRAAKIQTNVRALYDYFENGVLVSGDLRAQLEPRLAVSLTFDFFEFLPGMPEMLDGFMEVYRGNDRVSMGMSYVF